MEDKELLDRLEDMGAEVEDTLDRLMGDTEMYLQYLKKLPQDKNMEELRAAVEARDKDAAMKAVHTLKGVALNLGLLPLVDVCMDMLMDFREDHPEEAFAQFPEVEKTFQEWIAAIQESN